MAPSNVVPYILSSPVHTNIVSDNNETILANDKRFGLADITHTCLQWILWPRVPLALASVGLLLLTQYS